MAETDWLGMLGGLAGGAAGAYFGGPMGAQAGSALGRGLGSGISQESGLTQGEGFSDIGALAQGSMGGGGGGGFDLGSIFGMFGGGGGGAPIYRAPMMSTADLFGQAGGLLPGLAGSEVAYNQALQPGITGVQLNAEQQIAPGTFDLRRDALAARQRDLNLGYRLPPELQDLVITNTLQGLGSSGVGASDIGKLFGARSLAGAGLDRGEARIANALAASQFRPDYFTPRQPFGSTPGVLLAQDLRGVEAMQNDIGNLNTATQAAAQQKSSQDQKNAFSSLLGQAGTLIQGAGGNKGGSVWDKNYTGSLGSGKNSQVFGQGYNPNTGAMSFNDGSTNYNWNQGSLNNGSLGGTDWTSSYSFN